jgi:mRNA interferase RelE/StbE
VGKYRVLIKPSAVKEIENISRKTDRPRIVERIANLAKDPKPPGSKRLSGRDRYRLRRGPYRIIYSIQDDVLVVCVVNVGHRKDVYQAGL